MGGIVAAVATIFTAAAPEVAVAIPTAAEITADAAMTVLPDAMEAIPAITDTVTATGALTDATAATLAPLAADDASLGELGINTGSTALDGAAAGANTATTIPGGAAANAVSDADVATSAAPATNAASPVSGANAGPVSGTNGGAPQFQYTANTPASVANAYAVPQATDPASLLDPGNASGVENLSNVPPDPSNPLTNFWNSLSPEMKAASLMAVGGAASGYATAAEKLAAAKYAQSTHLGDQQNFDSSITGMNIQPNTTGGLLAPTLSNAGYTTPAAGNLTIGPNAPGGLIAQNLNPNLNPAKPAIGV